MANVANIVSIIRSLSKLFCDHDLHVFGAIWLDPKYYGFGRLVSCISVYLVIADSERVHLHCTEVITSEYCDSPIMRIRETDHYR